MTLAVHMILDASGSMNSIKDDTVGSVNEYIKTLRTESPEAKFWLTAFNSRAISTLVHGSIAKYAKDLTSIEYIPTGWTPLYDAIGKTIDVLQSTEADNKVLVIITDGLENASKEYTKDSIAKLLSEKQEKDNWLVLYLGANQDSFREGSNIGTRSINTMDFSPTRKGLLGSFRAAAASTMRYANSGSREAAAYTTEERKAASE